MQLIISVAIDNNRTSLNHNENMDDMVSGSKIDDMHTC